MAVKLNGGGSQSKWKKCRNLTEEANEFDGLVGTGSQPNLQKICRKNRGANKSKKAMDGKWTGWWVNEWMATGVQ